MSVIRTIAAFTTNTWASPLAILRVLGPAAQCGVAVLRGVEGERVFSEYAERSDALLVQRDFPGKQDAYRQIIEIARSSGKPLIYDLDDLLFDLPADHPDAVSGYYNEALLPMLHAILSADRVTVSSALLRETLRHLNPNVTLLPNCLDDRLWALTPPRTVEGAANPVVIGFLGGGSHAPDLADIAPALRRAAERFGERVLFRFVGTRPPTTLLTLPNVDWQPGNLDYARFAAAAPGFGFDIALAPLRDNFFNRCKSHIKFLEYSALGAAGIYRALEPYTAIVRHGENGLLAETVEDWENAISRLVETPELRLALARAAQETVRNGWLLSARAADWAQAWGQDAAQSPPARPALLSAVESALNYQQGLRAALAETQQRLAAHAAPAAKVSTTSARKTLAERVHTLRLRLAPPGSRREKWWRKLRPAPLTPALSRGERESFSPLPTGEEAAMFTGVRKTPDFLLLPVMDWASRRQRPQQLALQFAHIGRRVFYANTALQPGRPLSVQPVGRNIYEIRLPAPHPANLYFDAMSAALETALATAIGELKASFGIRQALVIVDLPFWTPLALRLRAEHGWPVAYDCMDYHAGFSTNTPAMLAAEERLIRESDVVWVTSHRLETEVSPFARHCLRVPNGADFEHFRFPAAPPPAEVASLPRPLIGYYGAIADWFDSELVAALAAARPQWSFALVGSTLYADLMPLQNLPNVHLLGEKAYADLPPYLHAFDVAIIPFKKTPLTDATNPVKLFEYLSAGKPVVASDLDELRYYAEYARLASSAAEWLAALEAALQDNAPARIQARLEFAARNTWEARVQEIITA